MMQGITIVHYPGQRSQAMVLNEIKGKSLVYSVLKLWRFTV